ncbi:MAG TPA: RES family NAD+ phosphorylase [Gemmatimonadaceae bacterium]|nr:RES family NAD+ phosphorylase [Gemmatimonadaceae bacterium]
MSSSIWTRCAGDSEIHALRLTPWRVVESQHRVSTRALVDTLEEQALLEEMIDTAKPADPTRGRLHYLLATPFRYPPLPHGSRFGARHERGIWYGAESIPAAMAEVAYYRLLFLEGTTAELASVKAELTAFRVRVRTERGVDLVMPPFASHRAAIASPTSYAASQPLGSAMREAGVQAFRYPSARDPEGGVNVGVMDPEAFHSARPRDMESWWCTATRERVELVRRDLVAAHALTFLRASFLVRGKLPAPGIA